MERRTAMATAVSLVATLGVGSLALASLGGVDVLGFGSTGVHSDPTILETSTVDSVPADQPVTVSGSEVATTTTAAEGLPPVIVVQPGATGSATQVPGGATSPSANTPVYIPVGANPSPTMPSPPPPAATPPAATTPAPAPPPSTPVTAPPTTAAPANTVPPGARIPSDWPADKPIPPIPPGCVEPVLEDNGVWNCEH